MVLHLCSSLTTYYSSLKYIVQIWIAYICTNFCFQLTFHKFRCTRNHQDNQLPSHQKMGRYRCNCFIWFFVDFYLLDARLIVANRNVQVDCFDIHFYHNSWRDKILQLKGMEGKLRFKDLTYMVCHPLMKFICIISLLAKHDLFFKLITWYYEISESILVGN